MKKDVRARRASGLILGKFLFPTIILVAVTAASAQTPASAPEGNTGNDLGRRIARARSLAVTGNLIGAARELEAVRQAAGADETIQDVTRVLLIGVYVEQSDYARAQMLLDETYNARTTGGESAVRAYYALAGRLLNSARAHLERYRAYNLNIADAETLPDEARVDLEGLRGLIGRVVEQSRTLRGTSETASSTDAAALFEDAATLRATLARNETERAQLQREVANARQHLAANNPRTTGDARRADARVESGVAPSGSPVVNQPVANQTGATNAAPTRQSSAPARQSPTLQSSPNNTTPGNSAPSPSPSPDASNNASTRAAGGNSATTGNVPVEVGSLVELASQRITPSYPQMARNQRVAGTVTVYLVINETGRVEAVSRTSGPAMLQQAARDAAQRWRFRPTVIDGRPVRVSGFINFNFTL